jgi:hypothetical protein
MYILRALAFFFFTQAALAQQRHQFRILSQFVRSPGIEGSMSGLFCVDFKSSLINLGTEVDEKTAVKLRDF